MLIPFYIFGSKNQSSLDASKEQIRKKGSDDELTEIFKQKNVAEQVHLGKQLDFQMDKFSKTLIQQEKDREERSKDRELEHRRLDMQEQAMKNQQLLMTEMLKHFTKHNS